MFTSGLNFEYENHLNSSGSFHGVNCVVNYTDNIESLFKINNKKENQIILELTNQKGERYFITTFGSSFWIADGLCGAPFELNKNSNYEFKIRLVDFSGNKSKESKIVQFSTN